MNPQHKKIRTMLSVMSPNRAAAYIKSFNLPADEENCLVECEVRGLSYVQAADRLNMSPECIKRSRRKAFAHIADELNNA